MFRYFVFTVRHAGYSGHFEKVYFFGLRFWLEKMTENALNLSFEKLLLTSQVSNKINRGKAVAKRVLLIRL